MPRSSRLLVLVVATTALAAFTPAALAQTSTTLTLTGGATTLTLDPATAQVLTDNGIAVAPVRPASASDTGIAFPISGGELDAATLAGQISHRGGLSFTAGGRTLRVTQFVIDTEESVLTARLFRFGPRIPLLDLDLSGITVAPGDGSVVVSGVGATLTPVAARALNLYFSTHLFTGGLPVGTATVDAELG